ncbi:WD repeat-containing protein 54 [Dermatophagoides farinae]|uniref:WD repeat-containing protein 54 n=1 Tax=Dermatophagoides farinae TaxID=6954 RepID=A0A922I8K9_DERFA|nr:uncharacterized protein LOC124492354 [Dermatophagoides farinae]KAH7641200.1 hypothetical protein HUG17_4244 [Dermatophagoides farinae]KAH9526936.1 WD repeat-containing protein 54 [Dermatophagoides farinae]
MYSQLNPIIIRLTTSACFDNLSIESSKDDKNTKLAVHDDRKMSVISIDNGANVIESSMIDLSNNGKFNTLQMIRLLRLQDKIYLISLSSKTLKIYSTDSGCTLLFDHNINDVDTKDLLAINSIERISKDVFCFVTQNRIRMFAINSSNCFVEKEFHQDLKSSTTSQIDKFISIGQSQFALFENLAKITIWKLNEKNLSFTRITAFNIHPNTKLTCIQVYKNLLLIGTVSGQIQIVNIKDGQLLGEIQAHIKCVTSMDVATNIGYLISGSEDSYARLFRLEQINENEFRAEFLQQFIAPNEMIFGTKFLNPNGSFLAISTFESNQIKIFKISN